MPAACTSGHIPTYRRHSTGNAFVELNGRRIYLGRYGTPESRQRYNRAIAEWLSNDRQLPVPPDDFTVVELLARFWRHADSYYRKPDGSPDHDPRELPSGPQTVARTLRGRARSRDRAPGAQGRADG